MSQWEWLEADRIRVQHSSDVALDLLFNVMPRFRVAMRSYRTPSVREQVITLLHGHCDLAEVHQQNADQMVRLAATMYARPQL